MINRILLNSLIVCFSFFSYIAFSQQIYVTSGIIGSSIDYKNYTNSQFVWNEEYKEGIIGPSVTIGFESKKLKRFSISSDISYFISGGKNDKTYFYSDDPKTAKFHSLGVSIIPNFYIINDINQFYIGAGPRYDHIASNLISTYNFKSSRVSSDKFGLTARIGFNHYFSAFFIGVRANYYYRFGNIVEYKDFFEIAPGVGQPTYFTVKVRERLAIDLQLVLGFQFNKK